MGKKKLLVFFKIIEYFEWVKCFGDLAAAAAALALLKMGNT